MIHRIQKVVAGIPRSGKSIVCKEITKGMSISYIPFDSIVSTLHDIYPELKVSHYLGSQKVSKKIAPFLKSFISHLKYEKIDFIIDIYQLFPIDIIHNKIDDVDFIFLGYPEIDVEKKLKQTREYAAPGDWSEDLSDLELRTVIQNYIAESKTMKKQCEEYDLTFIDMSYDFSGSLTKAVELIKKF